MSITTTITKPVSYKGGARIVRGEVVTLTELHLFPADMGGCTFHAVERPNLAIPPRALRQNLVDGLAALAGDYTPDAAQALAPRYQRVGLVVKVYHPATGRLLGLDGQP